MNSFQFLFYPFLLSKTNWNGNVITCVFDSLGLKLSRFEMVCMPHAQAITTEWHPWFRLPTNITESQNTLTMHRVINCPVERRVSNEVNSNESSKY